MRYVISYDLVTPGQNYNQLWEALRGFGAQRLLESQWIVRRNNTNAAGIRDALRACIVDANDHLLVTCLDNENWASWNTMVNPNTV